LEPDAESRASLNGRSIRIGILIGLPCLLVAVITALLAERGDHAARDAEFAERTESTRPEGSPELQTSATASVRQLASEARPAIPNAPAIRADTRMDVGTLIVVLTDEGVPVDRGRVELLESPGSRTSTREIDRESRRAVFENLPIGNCEVTGLSELPVGLLPPRALGRGAASDRISVDLTPGEKRLEVALERGVHVFGHVVGADHEPLDHSVRFMTIAENWDRSARPIDLRSVNGLYEGEIYDGIWKVELIDPTGGSGEREVLPAPRVLDLPAGSSTQIDLALERGSGRIQGRALDEMGNPFDGLSLYLYRHFEGQNPVTSSALDLSACVGHDSTKSDGGFSFSGLAPGDYRIAVSTDRFHPLAKPGENQIGAVVPERRVEVSGSEPVRTELVVLRPHPVHVQVRVSVDSEWRRRANVPEYNPIVHLLTADHRSDGLDTERLVDNGNREFDFYVDASVSEPRLRLTLGKETAIVPLNLVPDGLVPDGDLPPLVVRFPK
jgi:hypothetical protein